MGFWEFLSGLLPEAIIKLDQKNRKIQINGNVTNDTLNIIINDTKITDKEKINSFLDEVKKVNAQDSLPFQLIHKDLYDDYLELEDISIREKSNLKLLNEVLPLEDVECILMARRVLLAHDRGNTPKADELMIQLEYHYPKKGKKVYNLISCRYFDEMILPFISVYKNEFGLEKYVEEFRKFYYDLLKFFPIAIFIGNEMDERGIKTELNKRLRMDIPFIRLHALGSTNIEKAENVVQELGLEDRYTTKSEKVTTPSGATALSFEIKLKK